MWHTRFGSRGPAVHLEYVTGNHWPKRPGNTPYRGKADHAYVDFCIISKEANPSQLQRILKCLAAAKKPFQLTCRQYITNIWIYCIIVFLFCRFFSELDIFPYLLSQFVKLWNGQIFYRLLAVNSLQDNSLCLTLLRWLQTSLSENKQTKFKVRFIYRSCYFISRDMKLIWLFV